MEGTSSLPEFCSDYKKVSYWDERYKEETEKEWLLPYAKIKDNFKRYVQETSKILMLGCGNSLLSETMFKEGFQNITNIDYSPVVIQKMSSHCELCKKMNWLTMDAQKLSFPKNHFDVVIEKATIDAMLAGDRDQWNVSQETQTLVDNVLKEISRVLKDKGHFISISFSQPHLRGPLYGKKEYDWSLLTEEIGQDFHFYFYVMTKGLELASDSFFVYQPPQITMIHSCKNKDEDVTEESFLHLCGSL